MAQLAALSELYTTEQHHADWRAAVIVCTLANLFGRKKDDPIREPGDVMPWLKPAAAAEPAKAGPAQTPEEMRALMEQITREMGGIVHPRHVPLDLK